MKLTPAGGMPIVTFASHISSQRLELLLSWDLPSGGLAVALPPSHGLSTTAHLHIWEQTSNYTLPTSAMDWSFVPPLIRWPLQPPWRQGPKPWALVAIIEAAVALPRSGLLSVTAEVSFYCPKPCLQGSRSWLWLMALPLPWTPTHGARLKPTIAGTGLFLPWASPLSQIKALNHHCQGYYCCSELCSSGLRLSLIHRGWDQATTAMKLT